MKDLNLTNLRFFPAAKSAAFQNDEVFVIWSDGVYTYTFNHANQLVSVSGAGTTVSYSYNGQGDRLSQTVGITTTIYTLDLAAGLTQVLSDGTDTYLYGDGRIAQHGLMSLWGDSTCITLNERGARYNDASRYEPNLFALFSHPGFDYWMHSCGDRHTSGGGYRKAPIDCLGSQPPGRDDFCPSAKGNFDHVAESFQYRHS